MITEVKISYLSYNQEINT